jgi:hypothetical protein
MRSAALAALLLILPSCPALALCAGQSPDQKVIFEDRFADDAAQWFLNDRDNMKPTISNGVMTIEAGAAWAVPKREVAQSVPRAADICVRFSWPPASSTPGDIPEVGIITHAIFRSDRLWSASVRAVDRSGALKRDSLPFSDEYGPAYSPIILARAPEAGTGEVIEFRVVTTLRPGDDASEPGDATEKYFVNGKETAESSIRIDEDPNSEKQSYGIFVGNVAFMTDQADIKGSFPIRYFNVLSPN